MIIHNKKLIFIHIPKTGGTTIEKLFSIAPFNPLKPDYDYLIGWCPERKFYMQHATPTQMIETGLINRELFLEYTKIVIVRNTYARLVSDYFWHKQLIGNKGSFFRYLVGFYPFRFRNKKAKGTIKDYSSHILTQLDYIMLDGEVIMDEIFDFNNFPEILTWFSNKYSVLVPSGLHEKKGNYKGGYKSYYNLLLRIIVKVKYFKEIKYFKYKF